MQRSSMKNKKRHYDEVLLFGNHCVRLPSTTLHIQKIEKLHQIKFTWQEPDKHHRHQTIYISNSTVVWNCARGYSSKDKSDNILYSS